MGYVLIIILAGQAVMIPGAYLDREQCSFAGIDATTQYQSARFICVENGPMPLHTAK